MLTVHGELHYVVAGHPWQLLRNNILEFYQISHALKCPKKENNEETHKLTCHCGQPQTQADPAPLRS
jgi:hypothetical protein